MLGNPSRRNRRRQAVIGTWALSKSMKYPKLLANDVARGAADMNNPVRNANSSRLKKNDR